LWVGGFVCCGLLMDFDFAADRDGGLKLLSGIGGRVVRGA